jgi:hypothetical protein
MTTRRRNAHRATLSVGTRENRDARRAALAAADLDVGAELAAEAADLARVVGAELETERDQRKRGALQDVRYRMRKAGKGHLLAVAARLRADGGGFLRTVSRAAGDDMRTAVGSACVWLVRVLAEHDVESAAAVDMLARAALAGAVADCALARMVDGTATDRDVRVAEKFTTMRRLDVLAGLQVAEQARHARQRSGTIDLSKADPEVAARVLERARQRAEAEAADRHPGCGEGGG